MRNSGRLPGICLVGLVIAGCASVESNFDLSFSDVAGFHDERLDRIDSAIEAEIAAGKIAGAVAVIAKDGSIVYDKAFGYADIDSGKAMETTSIFRIASMSKAITSVGVMILYERGEFLLSDPVSEFLPAFANPVVAVEFDDDGNVTRTRPASREIRIIDLLTHTAGITYPFIDSPLKPSYERGGVIDGLTATSAHARGRHAASRGTPTAVRPGVGILLRAEHRRAGLPD